jgi:methylase of polypeptide subunit release factors
LSDDFALLEHRVELLEALKAQNYRFVTPTPATHARVLARKREAKDLRDVLGWSMAFNESAIDPAILSMLRDIDAIEQEGAQLKSRVRVSSLGDDLFLHSAFPTLAHDAVFFGPDSYRFATFIAAELPALGPRGQIVDVGAGSGVGGIAAARVLEHRDEMAIVTFTDINPAALAFAKANMLATAIPGGFDFAETSGLREVSQQPDLIIANPPYIVDPAHRAYRDGGGMHGGELSLTWAREAAERLEPGGAFLLYTGSAIVGGEDNLKAALFDALSGFDISYREIDPDVFGEELERADYAAVDRIAVVGLVAIKR